MAGYPVVNTDTVLYERKDIYSDKDISLSLLDGSKLDIFGEVNYNGAPLGGAGALSAPNTIRGNNTASTAAPIDLTVDQTKTLLALTKADIGLSNVDNTADTDKPVSTAQATAIAAKPNALNGLVAVWKGTAAEYDAIGTKDANTLYAVIP